MPDAPAVHRPRATTLHLVRHAETLWNEQGRMQGGQDSSLTSAGRYRSTLLAADLHEEPLEAVYASPVGSAIDTARILVAGRGLAVGACPDLREMSLGPWEGRRQEDIAREDPDRFHDFWQRPEAYAPREGEGFAEAQERLLGGVEGLIRAHRGGSILIVSHAIALQLLMASFAGRSLCGLWKAPELRPCSHSLVRGRGVDQARILRYAGLSWPPRPVKAPARRIATIPA